ncbi:MAG: hypothetical protein K6T59_12230 [Bryobacteraceae bacterium]|nr:hypothetical protein [Bryobacteraceae bacterium]
MNSVTPRFGSKGVTSRSIRRRSRGYGLVYANSQARSYTCPLTGEQLPSPKCCPLNEGKQQAQEQTFTCPVTGEELSRWSSPSGGWTGRFPTPGT